MVWGTFSIAHIISLFVAALLNIITYLILKNKNEKTKIIVLLCLSSFGILAIIFNLIAWNSPLEYLPFHKCNINAILIPFAIISKNKKLGNLLLLFSIGGLIALLVNHQAQNFKLLSITFLQYYLSHTFEFGIPILIFALKIIPLDVKTIPTTLSISLAILVIVHIINLFLNRYIEIKNIRDYKGDLIVVNYMFTIKPDNPDLEFFYNLIPVPLLYLIPIIPIFGLYLYLIYLIKIIKEKRKGHI